MLIKTEVKNLTTYKKYLKIKQATHEFMREKGYLEIDLPVLSPMLIPESYLEIFETEFKYFKNHQKLYLTPSPELFLKRLLAYGVGNCYYLGKCFRNSEPNSSWHLPEFTMLEFYKTNIVYLQLADEILELLRSIAQSLYQSNEIIYKGKKISFEKWEKISVTQGFEKYTGISELELISEKLFLQKAKEKNYQVNGFAYEDIFSQILTNEIEPHLGINGFPTLLYDFPKELASLAKMSPNGKTAERCEFYINGLEIGGFCTELTDYREQEKRFKNEMIKRQKAQLINHSVDNGFIEALKYGLVNCTGAGIGFDRLAMIFTNTDTIDKLKLINIL